MLSERMNALTIYLPRRKLGIASEFRNVLLYTVIRRYQVYTWYVGDANAKLHISEIQKMTLKREKKIMSSNIHKSIK